MATNFQKQATKLLNPAYAGQEQAIQSQVPAVNQLYEALNQGLDASRVTGTQNIFEDASGKGMLRSTIPVNLQTSLEQGLMQKRVELGTEQAQRMAGINGQLGQLRIDKTSAISSMANSLRQLDLQKRQFAWMKKQGKLDLRLKKQIANKEYQLRKQLAAMGAF